MNKIVFDDKSYIELKKSVDGDKLIFIIAAKDPITHAITIINSVELTQEQFNQLIKLEQ